VNTGDNGDWRPGGRDLDGNERVTDGRVDIGAYEAAAEGFTAVPWRGLEPLRVVFRSLVEVTNSVPSRYHWDFDADGSADVSGDNLAVVTNRFANRGVYAVSLSVSNAVDGLRTIDRPSAVHVESAVFFERIPAPRVHPLMGVFAARAFWTNRTGLVFRWDFDNDGHVDTEGPDLNVVTNIYPAGGLYSVSLTVSNGIGQVAMLTRTNVCRVGELSCSVSSEPLDHVYPPEILFTARVDGTYVDGLYYWWDFNNDGTVERQGPDARQTFYTYLWGFQGPYVARLTVSNAVGETASVVTTNLYDGGDLRFVL
jgi:PKD repeat protein